MNRNRHGLWYWLLIGWWWELLVLWFKACGYLLKGIGKLISFLFGKAQNKRERNMQPLTEEGQEDHKTASRTKNMSTTHEPKLIVEKYQEKLDIVVPSKLDGAPRAYAYDSVNYRVTDPAVVKAAIEMKEWEVSPKLVGEEVHFFIRDKDIGVCTERADMVKDWLKRNDPIAVYLQRLAANEDGTVVVSTVFLAFYRDRRKGQEWREQTVVALLNYKSKERQENMMFMREGDEVTLEEDYDVVFSLNGNYEEDESKEGLVYYNDAPIGKLPAKYVRKLKEQTPYGAFIETLEDEEKPNAMFEYYTKPYIRIYW